MKYFISIALITLICGCGKNTQQGILEQPQGMGGNYRPYYFYPLYKMYVLKISHSEDKAARPQVESLIRIKDEKREIVWSFATNGKNGYENRQITIPEEEYNSIRQHLGDTIQYYHTNTNPAEAAFVRDFTQISLSSDKEYAGIAAGESLNALVEISYVTCLPWIQSKHQDENGRICPPVHSVFQCPIAELNPESLDGSLAVGKLIFPYAPDAGQQFTIVFNGGAINISESFSF